MTSSAFGIAEVAPPPPPPSEPGPSTPPPPAILPLEPILVLDRVVIPPPGGWTASAPPVVATSGLLGETQVTITIPAAALSSEVTSIRVVVEELSTTLVQSSVASATAYEITVLAVDGSNIS